MLYPVIHEISQASETTRSASITGSFIMLAPENRACLKKLMLFGFAKSSSGIRDTQTPKVREKSAAAISPTHLVLVLFREEDGRPQTHIKHKASRMTASCCPVLSLALLPRLSQSRAREDLLTLLNHSTISRKPGNNTWLEVICAIAKSSPVSHLRP